MSEWTRVSESLPPVGVVVRTMINDDAGARNIQPLKWSGKRLWFVPDDSMYVYYTPTHWAWTLVKE